ncbi:MAG TPA: metallophosphoesterase [Xanthomonadales bacterium]|nr:metallophosphoesterase [Xanthomonadales bacterium]
MKKILLPLLLLVLFLPSIPAASAKARQVDDYHWTGVDRVVAIGDIHGDYENYIVALEAAGLVDRKGKWTGGETHLVQTGDIPDRGPDTVKIIEHLDKLAKQAKKKGGQVHSLIGNHEAMNVYGDLRYVDDGEFAAFAGRNSETLLDRYYDLVMQNLRENNPEAFLALPENYREEWNKTHPPGWVEHRQAWDPKWNPEGELAKRTINNKVAIQINDMVFLHGGLSGKYCQNSLESLTEQARSRLENYDPANPGILEDPYGPLWYRGLSGAAPEASTETVAAILNTHQAKHIVVGHTPTGGAIFTRYDGAVIQIDTGLSKAYGGHPAFLEVTPEGKFAGYPAGKLALPASDADRPAYLQKVIALYPANGDLKILLEKITSPPPEPVAAPEPAAGSATGEQAAGEENPPAAPVTQIPTCGISQ